MQHQTLSLIFLLAWSLPLWGAQVVKVSSNPKYIAVSQDSTKFQQGDQVCVMHDGKQVACGKVRKSGSKAAIVELTSRDGDVVVEDEVVLKSGSSESRRGSRRAKDSSGRGSTIGLQAGVSMSSLYIDPPQTSSSKMGLAAGLNFDFPLCGFLFGSDLTFGPELQYVQKGAKGNGATVAINYLELPLMLRIRFGSPGFAPYIFAGPVVGYLMGASVNVDGGGSTDFKSQTNSLDFGVAFGGGSAFQLGESDQLFVNIRYGFSFSNLLNTDQLVFSNQGFQFLLGYAIRLNKLF
jgi:hypothetical protein